jgi:hypothetical protein
MFESLASCFAFRCSASLNMTAAIYKVVSSEKSARSLEKFGPYAYLRRW